MFGISLPELLVVLAITLLVLGPDKLPDAARKFGRFMAFVRKNSEELRREFYQTLYKPAQEAQYGLDQVKRELKTEATALPSPGKAEEKSEVHPSHDSETSAPAHETVSNKLSAQERPDQTEKDPKDDEPRS